MIFCACSVLYLMRLFADLFQRLQSTCNSDNYVGCRDKSLEKKMGQSVIICIMAGNSSFSLVVSMVQVMA